MQLVAAAAYLLLAVMGLAQDVMHSGQDPLPMPVTVLAVFAISALVMASRFGYAVRNGLWKADRATNEHVSIWAEAFIPERTTVVSLLIFGVMTIGPLRDLYEQDEVTDVLNALLVTGGLIAALITSPQHLPKLVKVVAEDRKESETPWVK